MSGIAFSQAMVWVVITATFLAVSLIVVSGGGFLQERRMSERLRRVSGDPYAGLRLHPGVQGEADRVGRVLEALSRLSLPDAGLADSALRQRFARAGFRGENAPALYYALKTALTVLLPLATAAWLAVRVPEWGGPLIAAVALGLAVIGFYLPDALLAWRTRRRQQTLRNDLPDMIDLMLVCVESGLGLDAAINRVAREIARSSPLLSEEFHLAYLEIRAGATRSDALRHLADRIGIEDLDSLVSMLLQAERFGTSLGDALRVHSEFMRVRRVQRAEELAARIPLKMLFPLVLLIFPSLLLVILGPALIQIRSLLLGS